MSKFKRLFRRILATVAAATLALTAMPANAADTWTIQGVTSDTSGVHYVPKNGYYSITLTADEEPEVKVSDPNVFAVYYTGNIGKQYHYNLTAIGDMNQHATVIVNGQETDIDLNIATNNNTTSDGYTITNPGNNNSGNMTVVAKGNFGEITIGLKSSNEQITVGTTNSDAFQTTWVGTGADGMSKTYHIEAIGNYGEMANLVINGVVREPLFQVGYLSNNESMNSSDFIYQRLWYSSKPTKNPSTGQWNVPTDGGTGQSLAGDIGDWALGELNGNHDWCRVLWLYRFYMVDPINGNKYVSYCVHDRSRRSPELMFPEESEDSKIGYNGSSSGSVNVQYGSPLYNEMTAALLCGYTGVGEPIENEWDDYWATQFLLWEIRDSYKDSYTLANPYRYVELSPDLQDGTIEANIINWTAKHLYDKSPEDEEKGNAAYLEWQDYIKTHGHKEGDVDQDFLDAYKQIKHDWYTYLYGMQTRPSFTYSDSDGAVTNANILEGLSEDNLTKGYEYNGKIYKYGITLTDTNNVVQNYIITSDIPEGVFVEQEGNQVFVMSDDKDAIDGLVLEFSIPVLKTEQEYKESTNEIAKLLYKVNHNGGAPVFWFNYSGDQDQITYDYIQNSQQQPTKGYVSFETPDNTKDPVYFGPIRIYKTDENAVNGLADAGFSVFTSMQDATNETNAISAPDDATKTIFYTDAEGKTDFGGMLLRGGRVYYIKEMQAPEGFERITDIIRVYIPDEDSTAGQYEADPNNPTELPFVSNIDISGQKYIQIKNNEQVEITKSVQTVGNVYNTAGMNEPQTFILTPDVPSGIEQAKTFTITDTLDSRLTFTAGQTVSVQPASSAHLALQNTPFTQDTDYKITGPDANNMLTIEITGAGRNKLAQYGAESLRIEYTASINRNVIYNGTTHTNSFGEAIPNTATLDYVNASGTEYKIDSNEVEIHTGAIEIQKTDEYGAALQGAQFELYDTKEDAENGVNKLSFTTIVPNNDGTTSEEIRDYATSDANGIAYIYGVPYGRVVDLYSKNYGLAADSKSDENKTIYWLKEISAPEGYILDQTPIEVTVSGTTPIVNITVPNNKDDGNALKIQKSVQNLNNNDTTANIGTPSTFILTPTVPDGIETSQQYTVVDQIDSRLTYTANQTISVQPADASGKPYDNASLVEGQDFTVTLPSDANTNTLTIDFTARGRQALNTANAQKVSITFTASLNRNVVTSESFGVAIPNTATVTYKANDGTIETATSNEVEVHTGAAAITKTSSDGTLLSGVEFKIYASADDAKNDKNALTFMDEKEDLVTSTTTNDNGVAYFYGLPYGPLVTVGSNETGLAQDNPAAENTTNYWIKETKTLDGYQLNEEPVMVSVSNVNPMGTVAMVNYKDGEEIPPETPDISKSVGKPGNTDTTAAINSSIPFILSAKVPESIADATQYTVTDQIDSRLSFDSSQTISVVPADGAGNAISTTAPLARDRDYQITMPSGSNSNTLTVAFTEDGRKALADLGAQRVLITYTASINTSATDSIGVAIPNQASLTYTNKAGVTATTDSNEVEVHTGAVEVTKVDDKGEKLAGAEFQIFSSESDADALKNPLYVINEDGEEVTTVTTGADGKAVFYGLPYGPEVTSANTTLKGYAADDTSAGNSTVYYVAESQAPDGYTLLDDPVRVVINGTTTTAAVTIENTPSTTPPGENPETPSIEKSVGKLGNADTTATLGEELPFFITPEVPYDIATAKTYTIVDELDNRLTYTDGQDLTVRPADENGKALSGKSLREGTDYTVETPADDNHNTLTVAFTEDGRQALADADASTVLISFTASLNGAAIDTIGQKVPNQAHLAYTNSANEDFDVDSNEVEVHTGAIVITKTGTDGKVLPGATFQVYGSLTDAQSKTNPVTFFDAQGNPQTTVTTSQNGTATMYGLPYGPQISEDSEGNGYSATSTAAANATTYYLVETQAPAGYTLLNDPVAVTVSGSTPTGTVTVENGTTPNGTTPNGTTPNGTTPNGTTPNGTTPGTTTDLTGKTSPQTGDTTAPLIALAVVGAAACVGGALFFKRREIKAKFTK